LADQYAGQSGPCKFCGQIITIPKPRLSLLAVSSVVLSGVSFGLGCFAGLPGVILGFSAWQKIRRSNGTLRGLKLAKAGVWIGGIVTALHIGTVVVVMFVAMMQVARDTPNRSMSNVSSPASEQPGFVVEEPAIVAEEPDPASKAQRTIDPIQKWKEKTEQQNAFLRQLRTQQTELERLIASSDQRSRSTLEGELAELKKQIRAVEKQCEQIDTKARHTTDLIQPWKEKTEQQNAVLRQLRSQQTELERSIASSDQRDRDTLEEEFAELKKQIRKTESGKVQCELNVEILQSKDRHLRRVGWLQEAVASDAEWNELVRLALEVDEQLSDVSSDADVNNVLESLGSTPSGTN